MSERIVEALEKENAALKGQRCSTCISWKKGTENELGHRECDRLYVFTSGAFGCTEWEQKP